MIIENGGLYVGSKLSTVRCFTSVQSCHTNVNFLTILKNDTQMTPNAEIMVLSILQTIVLEDKSASTIFPAIEKLKLILTYITNHETVIVQFTEALTFWREIERRITMSPRKISHVLIFRDGLIETTAFYLFLSIVLVVAILRASHVSSPLIQGFNTLTMFRIFLSSE